MSIYIQEELRLVVIKFYKTTYSNQHYKTFFNIEL